MSECLSCGHELDEHSRKGTPSVVECCRHCWNRMPVSDRLNVAIKFRDRMPGGAFSELAEALGRANDVREHLGDIG